MSGHSTATSSSTSPAAAKAWHEKVTIPTYPHGEPDKNPMFLERRVYQGSSGAVYPFPVIDSISDEKVDREYDAVYLENRYLKIMLLPSLGGRVQTAYDKTNGYPFVYHNHVIKPALVGLIGPWISGGIEFNWPQHHRPSTFMPVSHWIENNEDGSATVYISEIDRMFGTRCMASFTLHPDKAYLQIDVKLYNRTGVPQTFLWWANPAVAANDGHQTVMPPDVHAVMDHGKRDVSSFPIATGEYYKVDYGDNDAGGTDISRYRNLPVPTSYMAYHSDYDFVASYDHNERAGLLHVANHHVSPGKKQWTWGNGDFGQAWDRQLTDEDGPYIELMCGVFTDNQPDFSWLEPYEEKRFTQYFMPYKGVGVIKNASTNGAINLELRDGSAYLAAYVTSPRENLKLVLTGDTGAMLHEASIDALSPEGVFEAEVDVGVSTDAGMTLCLIDADGRELISYTPVTETPPIPLPAKPVLPIAEVPTCEQLYLSGQHLEQYRHATLSPEPYYREALKRDASDSRNNNALGMLLYRRGLFNEAEAHFRAAVETLTQRNPNPHDGEPLFNLGLSLQRQGKLDKAFDAFHKSIWNNAMKSQGNFELAKIEAVRGNWLSAVNYCDESLINNWHHHKARHLKTAALRQLDKDDAARLEAKLTLTIDPMDAGAFRELALLGDADAKSRLDDVLRNDEHNYIELALDYATSGLYDDAVAILRDGPDYTMSLYLSGWFKSLSGDDDGAALLFAEAAEASPVMVLPHRLEERLALEMAVARNPQDGVAWALLGTLQYAKRDYTRAIDSMQKAEPLLPGYATVRRNLALAYANVLKDLPRALAVLEEAFACDASDARVLFELDQLRKRTGTIPAKRLALLDQHASLVERRDDLFVEHLDLLNLLGKFDVVQQRIAGRLFHPWEGGEGKVSGAYVTSLLGRARQKLADGHFAAALEDIEQSRTFPHNLSEGKLHGALENDADYLAGLAYRGIGETAAAAEFFDHARVGLDEPASAMYYNDQPPSMLLYQGLSAAALGLDDEADQRFAQLIDYGSAHVDDDAKIDFFAVSLPEFQVFEDDLTLSNVIHCHYMMGLGHLGRCVKDGAGDAEAKQHLQKVLELDPSHGGATTHLRQLEMVDRQLTDAVDSAEPLLVASSSEPAAAPPT